MCVCVCERERETDRQTDRDREREKLNSTGPSCVKTDHLATLKSFLESTLSLWHSSKHGQLGHERLIQNRNHLEKP